MSKTKAHVITLTPQEYVDLRYQKMLSSYPAIKRMKERRRPGSFVEAGPSTPLQPFPFLDQVDFDKQRMLPEQMREKFNALQGDPESATIYFGGGFDQYFPGEWKYRCIEVNSDVAAVYGLSHSVVSFMAVGDKNYYFENPEDDYLDATVVARRWNDPAQAFLLGKRKDGREAIIELDDFCLLSLDSTSVINETVVFIVFNKKNDFLYIGEIEGFPNLMSAKLPYL